MNSVQSGAVMAHVSRHIQFERVTLAAVYSVDATGGGRNLSDHSENLGEQVLRNRDLGHLERDMARVADDLRANANRRRAVAHEIGA